MVETSKGRIVTSITIDKKVREELKRKGIPLGTACKMWLEHVDDKTEHNETYNRMTDNIAKLQDLIKRQAERIAELETGEKKNEKPNP